MSALRRSFMSPISTAVLSAFLLTFALPSTTQAAIFTYTGDTTGSPTFNRPVEDLSTLSAVGTAVRYDAFTFSVTAPGEYTFLTTATYDPFVVLYSPTFNPATPLTNAKVADDDLLGFSTSGVAFDLAISTSYTFVNTAFDNAEFGFFSTTIGGPGTLIPVPEPAAAALLAGVSALLVRRSRRR